MDTDSDAYTVSLMRKILAATVLAILLVASSSALANDMGPAYGPVDPSQTRYSGFVYDLDTGAAVSGVCVYAGPAGCPDPALRTDSRGYWALDLPTGLTWDFHFDAIGHYQGTIVNIGTRSVVVLIPHDNYESGQGAFTITTVRR